MELDIRQYLSKAKENQDGAALQAAYSFIIGAAGGGKTPTFPPELLLVCAETAQQHGRAEISAACLKAFFEGNPAVNQFLCRAFVCQGQLKAPPAAGTVDDLNEAVMYFLKAIEISKNEPRYHFMVFNASVLYFQAVRPFLQPGRCRYLVSSLKQVVQSLEEVSDPDHSWRAELMIHLVRCLVDSGQLEDAANFAIITENFIKAQTPHLYPKLYKLQVKFKLSGEEVLLETSKQSTTLTVIYKIQELKKWLEMNNNMLTREDSGKLEEIFDLLDVNSVQQPAAVPLADRAAFLLELALLSLQGKHLEVAGACLKELKSCGEANIEHRIIMDCVSCEMNLLQKEAKMDDYSKASVEARLKEINKLDQWLQAAAREGSPQVLQALCATQWRFCLPLLQQNLRNRIKTPLLRIAQVLEDTQSVLLEMRCHVHSELAGIEEEEGNLQVSSTHLQKAVSLDNGTQGERLSSALRLLELRAQYRTPPRPEDRAALLLQQARDMPPRSEADMRPVLVSVGLLLAPEDFQTVLDADNTSEIPVGGPGPEPAALLAAKVQHHTARLQQVGGHLDRQSKDKDSTERMKLWATLAKTARKQEVWDVCRAACRFCLLYDDGRWKISKTDKCKCSEGHTDPECPRPQVHLLRLLAEVCFIGAEATIQKLLSEGVRLNSPAVRPQEGVGFSEEEPNWVIYRDWIQALSAYATSSFLRAGELGAEIGEQWVVTNAAIYLWNYNSHLLAAGEYQLLVPTFQRLVEMLQKTKTISPAVCVLLCDAAARGLIQPLSESDPAEPKGKTRPEKGGEKSASSHGVLLDPATLQDIHKALELCEFALHISRGQSADERVPIAVRQRVLTSWVQIKRLLRQQIGPKVDMFKDESESEDVSAMTRVLVGVEMVRSNRNPKLMEFSAPSLSALVSMASGCSWSDAAVELQVWCQLAAFCCHVKDFSLVLRCTQTALQLEEAAGRSLSTGPCVLFGRTAVDEMLSSAACLRGLSLVSESRGDLRSYREALELFLSGVSFAEKADNQDLCVAAAGHYWNACQPLTHNPQEGWQLKENLQKILNALIQTTRHEKEQSRVKGLLTLRDLPAFKHEAINDKGLTLRAAVCSLLFDVHVEESDSEGALQLLDRAIRDMPTSTHRRHLLEKRILLKARLGESIDVDMQKLQDEGGRSCSWMWHQVALCAGTIDRQLYFYQRAMASVRSSETPWRTVSLLLEFGAWLFCQNFHKADAQLQVQRAVDLLLQPKEPGNVFEKNSPSELAAHGSFRLNVCRLDQLIRAHTLLAVMSDRTSHDHQLHLLTAYTFVLQMWQVSMAVASEISSEMAKSQPPPLPPPPHPPVSVGSKKGKDKKVKEPPPAEEKPEAVVLDLTLPSTPTAWAQFVCPDPARQIFRTSNHRSCINQHSISQQSQSLFFLTLLEKELLSVSLDHLTLPVLHLAEVIARDLCFRKSLSDLYRLRIVRTCAQLGLESISSYQEKLLNLIKIQEEEQMESRKVLVILQRRRSLHTPSNQSLLWRPDEDVTVQDIWLDKAEVCLFLNLHPSARRLLAEAHMVAEELGDKNAVSRSLLNLARLACEEQNFSEALILLDEAQTLGGPAEFWYQLTLIRVTAVVGQRDPDSQTQVDRIITQGCEALQLLQTQQINRVPELRSLIASLNTRGAVEYIRAVSGADPAETLSAEVIQKLTAACDSLRESAAKLSCRDEAAEAHRECSCGLRLLASFCPDREEKHRLLLDGLSHMQLAVTLQEHVAFNAQNLLPHNQGPDLSLAAVRRLVGLRFCLAELSLDVLEEQCAVDILQALEREKKTSVEILLEEFTRSTPEPSSTEQEWATVGKTLGQLVLSQLAAISFQSSDNMELRARCLSLTGKYLRLLAVHEEPLHVRALWDTHKQETWSDSKCFPTAEEISEKDTDPSRNKRVVTSAGSSELQRGLRTQQLLEESSKLLSEAVSLGLQHNVSSSILADTALNLLECVGQSDPAVAGQYLALFQTCCTVAVSAEVLSSACADSSGSQLSALLSVRRNLLLSQEERPSSRLKAVEDSLNSLSKAFSQLSISPNHLSFLSEIPPNLKILLLQHSTNGSELYGAVYEKIKAPENLKGKTTQTTQGTLACSKVAKASVCPQALLALRDQVDCLHAAESCLQIQKRAEDTKLTLNFRDIVKNMDEYLNPLLSQFDFSFVRSKTASLPVSEITKSKTKEEACPSDKAEPDEYVVLLADRKLLELPLEASSVLQDEGLVPVTRDFSLQLLCRRLNRGQPLKVESDNRKETKAGKGLKGKGDQSQTMKALPANHVTPSYTSPVDTHGFKCIIDPYNERHLGGSGLRKIMKEVLDRQSFTHLWDGSKDRPSLSEVEQVLCRCSAFIYLGGDSFLANVAPVKVAALDLSDCRVALLFDRVQDKMDFLHQSNLENQTRAGQFALETPVETCLLLSLSGVGCIFTNQWSSSLQQTAHSTATVLDNFMRTRRTSGQTIGALRGVTGTHDPQLLTDSSKETLLTPAAFNCVLYGLPNLIAS
ncbi:cilia- and flagella-associated protein 46 [Kryptolebias marmoratus]|nr:cilia- and flagella-associated protein 46 [Kryptolebias marmoratus]